jgi:hypothetical protein
MTLIGSYRSFPCVGPYSTIKRDSGLFEGYARPRDAIEALEAAFEKLKSQDVLLSFTRTDITGSRKKLQDVVFELLPSIQFVSDTKAGSKRLTNGNGDFANR